ncbi:MAG: hypothetical protein NUV57_00990 [archaeon]|nr:hypothetical protein [archaeon]
MPGRKVPESKITIRGLFGERKLPENATDYVNYLNEKLERGGENMPNLTMKELENARHLLKLEMARRDKLNHNSKVVANAVVLEKDGLLLGRFAISLARREKGIPRVVGLFGDPSKIPLELLSDAHVKLTLNLQHRSFASHRKTFTTIELKRIVEIRDALGIELQHRKNKPVQQ